MDVIPFRMEPADTTFAEELFQLIDRSREHLRKWLAWVDGVESPEDTRQYLLGAAEQALGGLGCNYVIISGGRAAGVAGFHPVDLRNRNAELGYWLGSGYTGMGLATLAVKELLREGFHEMGLNRIEIRCASGNLASIAVARRAGLIYEGTLREEELLYDAYVDHDVFSILKREFCIGTD